MKGFLAKLSKILSFLVLVLIPTQLGKHFWLGWSYVLGIRIDYLSPTLYLIDLFWLVLLVIDIFLNKKEYRVKKVFNFGTILGLVFVVINVMVAKSSWLAFYRWLRLGQLVWMWWYIIRNKELVKSFLVKIVPFWIGFESLLAVGQISKGGSLNGIFWFFGERAFNFNTIGIAQMSIWGNGLVRAYGTFSHPNSLAGFLLVSLFLWYGYRDRINPLKWWVITWLSIIGIVLTGSRTIWVLTLAGIILFLIKGFENWRKVLIIGLVTMGLISLVLGMVNFNYPLNNFLGGWDENGLIKRGQLNVAALGEWKSSMWMGVGAGNFLVRLPEFQKNNQIFWLQPVHNIFLLSLAEIGVLGVLGWGWILFNWFKDKKIEKKWFLIFGIIGISGMMDHYWLTLPQNMWLLAVVLGIM